MEENKRYIVAIEIASSKITGIAALLDKNNEADEICHYEEKIDGPVIYGEIKNADAVASKVSSILQKIENNKNISPYKIKSVYVGINARSLHSTTVTIEKDINENIPIDEKLMSQIENESRAKINSETDKILIARRGLCEIDGKETTNPTGSLGSHISVTTTIITCRQKICKYIEMVFERLKVNVIGYIPTQLALAKLPDNIVLTSEGRQLGCMLVDFGSDTTAVSIYKNDRLLYLNTIPMGSRNITRDLMTLNILPENAEKIKYTYGIMKTENVVKTEIVPGVSSTDVVNYINARAGEIIENIRNQMTIAGIKPEELPGGIRIIGQGAKLKGFNEMLEHNSKMTVHKGGWSNKDDYNDRIASLAILDTASNLIKNGESCMYMPLTNTPEQPTVEQHPAADTSGEPKKKGFFGRLKDSISKGIGTAIGEDDDEDYK